MAGVNEWVEAAGSSVDVAVEAAMAELGVESRDQVEVEVLREPVKGVLGTSWRAQDALVKVTPKPPEKKGRRRSRRRSRSRSKTTTTASGSEKAPEKAPEKTSEKVSQKPADKASTSKTSSSGSPSRSRGSERSSSSQSSRDRRPSSRERRPTPSSAPASAPSKPQESPAVTDSSKSAPMEATIEEQAEVAAEFVRGLLEAYGLEGDVATTIDEDILKIDITGDQTEALVGRKGVIMQSVLDVTRTVVQRKTFGAPRMRIDINGYAERRREALRIYTTRQAEALLEEGGELMLEPMNAADRKVIHDAVAEIDGVESFSEGEDPHRAVVIRTVD